MIYVKKISEHDYKDTIATMADHVLLTKAEAENYSQQHIETVHKMEELRLNLEMEHEDKKELKRTLNRMRNEQDMLLEFTREHTAKECNAQNQMLRAMYDDAVATIAKLREENNILRSELEQDCGFYFV